MAKAVKNTGKFPSSVKFDPELKQAIDDYCWLHRKTFSSLMEELAREFLAKNPLTKQEKAIVERYRKEQG